MKVSLEWLNEYIQVNEKEALEILPKLGLDIDDHGKPFNIEGPIVFGKLEDVQPHPKADKLVVCKINVGTEFKTILTADKSVKVGKYVYVASEGAIVANGLTIQNREMRGVLSEGMLCSLEELGIEEKSEHVYTFDVLPEGAHLGDSVIEYLGLNDYFFEPEITPNRGDCLSYFGITRELSAWTKRTPKFPIPKAPKGGKDKVEIIIDSDGCWRYTGRVIRNVKIGPSPWWLQRRLIVSGLRPINNVVDITNYVMLETGHPVHAFDLRKIRTGKIVVRDGVKGEKVKLLDEKEYILNGGEVLITDGENILALGGIMGGEESGIYDDTTDILLEVAMFDPVKIRKPSKALGVSSDSSYRFERGVDFDNNVYVIERLSELIHQLAGGTPSEEIVDIYPKKLPEKIVEVEKSLIEKVLGEKVENIEEILKPLGFDIEEDEKHYKVFVPSFRYFDVGIPEDIVEEVGRIHGYENLKGEPPKITAIGIGRNEKQKIKYELKNLLTAFGYNEAYTLTFVSSEIANKLGFTGNLVKVANPIISEFDSLRPYIFYGLLDALSYNYRRQQKDVKLFEMGKVFEEIDGKPVEYDSLAGVATGRENPHDYTDKREISFYSVKGVVEDILRRFGLTAEYKLNEINSFVPTRTVEILVNGENVGFIGMLDPEVADKVYDVKDEIYIFELNLEKLYSIFNLKKEPIELPQYPYVRRDISYLVPKSFEVGKLLQIYKSKELVEEVGIDDIYNIDEQVNSITIYALFRHKERTLSEEEVNGTIEEIKQEILDKYEIKTRF